MRAEVPWGGGDGPRDLGAFGLGLVGSLIVDLPDLDDA